MLITGNALFRSDCLVLLERMQMSQVDLAYVDAPLYPEAKESLHGIEQLQIAEHWDYLSQVLQQIRRVLNDTGTLFFNTNPFSPVNARLILDRIFGKENFRAEIIWHYRLRSASRLQPALDHNTILFYSKSDDYTYRELLRPLTEDEIRKQYRHKDDIRGPYRLIDLTRPAEKSASDASVFEWRGFSLPSERTWRYKAEKLEQLASENAIRFPRSKKGRTLPKLKIFASKVPLGFIWEEVYPLTKKSSLDSAYPSNRSPSLMEKIVEMGSNPGDLVFDPFTTSDQVLEAAHKANRRWLGCVKSESRYHELIEGLRDTKSIVAGQDFQTDNQDHIEDAYQRVAHVVGLRPAIESDLSSFAHATRPDPVRNRWAVLIGVNSYVDPHIDNLSYCVNDVQSLRSTLMSLGYNVVCLHDDQVEALWPTRANIEEELARVCNLLSQDDFLLVHFSGHGKRINGVPVLITREARVRTLEQSGLSVPALERQMRSSPARRLLLTLDACQSGLEMGREIPDREFITNVHELAEGFALIAASTARQPAQEERGFEQGVFTHFLVDGLGGNADRESKRFVTVGDLRDFTLDGLRRWNATHDVPQEPTARTEGIGDMIVADYRRRPGN